MFSIKTDFQINGNL